MARNERSRRAVQRVFAQPRGGKDVQPVAAIAPACLDVICLLVLRGFCSKRRADSPFGIPSRTDSLTLALSMNPNLFCKQ